MGQKRSKRKENLPDRMGGLIRKATMTTGGLIVSKDFLTQTISNVGKVRKDVLSIFTQEVGKLLGELADNYTIRVKAEFNLERKKNRKPKA